MKNLAIVQCRMCSTRLPNKMMLWLHGYPIIEWVRYRVKKSEFLSNVIFAIPDTHDNDILEYYLKSKGENVFSKTGIQIVNQIVDEFKVKVKQLEDGLNKIKQEKDNIDKAIRIQEEAFNRFKVAKNIEKRELEAIESEGQGVLDNLKHILKVK